MLIIPAYNQPTKLKDPRNADFFSGIKSVWLGAIDIKKEGHWIAPSNRKKITYSNWRNGEPNNGGGKEHCAEYATNGRSPIWTYNQCTEKLQFVCRY